MAAPSIKSCNNLSQVCVQTHMSNLTLVTLDGFKATDSRHCWDMKTNLTFRYPVIATCSRSGSCLLHLQSLTLMSLLLTTETRGEKHI